MERDEKIQLLLDMQEHPEQFSEQALHAMLADPDVRELMEATALLKQAMISEEWSVESGEFHTGVSVGSTFRFSLQKVAASIIGILMVSGIAFAAIHVIRQQYKAGTEQAADTTVVAKATVYTLNSEQPQDTIPSTVVRYDEATLEQILTDMSGYYGLTLNWKSGEAKSLRLFYIWNKQQSAAEAIRSMNSFERICLELRDSILTIDR